MSKPQRKVHLFNCDHVYELRVVADFLNATKQEHDFDFLVEEHYFSLPQIFELSEKIIPELQMDFAIFVVHAHESRLSINEDDCGYTKVYRALLQATGGNVIIIIGGDDSYKDEDEEDKEFISRWARRKIYLQFSEEFMDGRKSFIFSWNKKHREIHEKALLHFFDPSKKGEKFEYQLPTKRQLPPKTTTPPPLRPSEPKASSRPYYSFPAEGTYTGERVQSTKPDVPVESRVHRISDQGARPKEKRSSSTETKDLVILGCSVSKGSIHDVMRQMVHIHVCPELNLQANPPVVNLSPTEIKQYLERNWVKFCVLVVDAETVKDANENLPKRRDEYEELLKTAMNRVAEKVIILVCDSLPLRQNDEEIVHQTIYRIIKEGGKGFIAWLKNGKLTVEPDDLVQFLLSSKPTMGHIPHSSLSKGSQRQSNVPLFSATASRQTYVDQKRGHLVQPSERETRYGPEKQNMQQPRGAIQQSNPPASTTYTGDNPSTGKPVLKSKLRYGKISYEKRDLELLNPEFQGISDKTAQTLLENYGNISEIEVKIMSDLKDNTVCQVVLGDFCNKIADNETLVLKTRVRKGLISFHEDDLEFLYPGWKIPLHILENLKSKASEGKLFVICDEKGNLRCSVQSGVRDKVVSATDNIRGYLFSSIVSKDKET